MTTGQLPDDKDGQYTGDEPGRQNPPVETVEDVLIEEPTDVDTRPGTRGKTDTAPEVVPNVDLTPTDPQADPQAGDNQ